MRNPIRALIPGIMSLPGGKIVVDGRAVKRRNIEVRGDTVHANVVTEPGNWASRYLITIKGLPHPRPNVEIRGADVYIAGKKLENQNPENPEKLITVTEYRLYSGAFVF